MIKMKKHKSKWFYGWDMNEIDKNDPIVFIITEEMIQNLAEPNIGRELTDVEMNRVFYAFTEDDRVIDSRDGAMIEAIYSSQDNEKGQWKALDDDFVQDQQKKKAEKMK